MSEQENGNKNSGLKEYFTYNNFKEFVEKLPNLSPKIKRYKNSIKNKMEISGNTCKFDGQRTLNFDEQNYFAWGFIHFLVRPNESFSAKSNNSCFSFQDNLFVFDHTKIGNLLGNSNQIFVSTIYRYISIFITDYEYQITRNSKYFPNYLENIVNGNEVDSQKIKKMAYDELVSEDEIKCAPDKFLKNLESNVTFTGMPLIDEENIEGKFKSEYILAYERVKMSLYHPRNVLF